MSKLSKIILVTFAVLIWGNAAQAEDFAKQVQARQAVMKLYAFNLGMLGGMAKGDIAYDAAKASSAANNLNALVNLDNSALWPAGSDMSAAGMADKTRAKKEIWENFAQVGTIQKDLIAAAGKMASEAGNGVDAIRANIGAIGKNCGACHKPFRAEK
ncbi:MAG: cytochrome c [Alphaproteobacteria bacterium]|nr:cytochrome c [Alphaproteobacteria bacterium]